MQCKERGNWTAVENVHLSLSHVAPQSKNKLVRTYQPRSFVVVVRKSSFHHRVQTFHHITATLFTWTPRVLLNKYRQHHKPNKSQFSDCLGCFILLLVKIFLLSIYHQKSERIPLRFPLSQTSCKKTYLNS